MKRYINVHLFSYQLLDLFKIYSLQSCEKCGKQRLRQLTCDLVKYLTTLANLFFHFSSLFLLSGWFLLFGSKKFQTALLEGSLSLPLWGLITCAVPVNGWLVESTLVESTLLGTQNRKRDKTHIAWFSLKLSELYHSHFLIVI